MSGSRVVRTMGFGAALLAASASASAAQFAVPPGASVTLQAGSVGLACANLTVQGSMAVVAGQIGIAGNVTIATGATLDGGSGTLTVGGNWDNAGTFTRGTSTVVFADGCTTTPAQLTGSTSFTNLTFTSTAGRNFVIPAGRAISVAGLLVLSGAPGLAILVSSTDPTQPTFIVLGPGGSVTNTNATQGTNVAIDTGNPARLANISTRMQVLTGNDVMIGGFIIGGATPKTVVVRARGPSLVPFGITNALADPTLDLYSGQTVIATNNDFGAAPNLATLQASGFSPGDAKEAAILSVLNPGAYTAIVSGVGNTTGVGIVEVFEVDSPQVPLANISTRGQVLTGNDVMIGGFVIQGDAPQTVVVRARGPSLIPFGITNALANPVLQLFSGQTLIASNDDWESATNAAAITSSGFAPSSTLESAILITLNPGAYTAIVTGASGATGVGIVEVFAQ